MRASLLLGQVAMHELCYGLFDSNILCSDILAALLEAVST